MEKDAFLRIIEGTPAYRDYPEVRRLIDANRLLLLGSEGGDLSGLISHMEEIAHNHGIAVPPPIEAPKPPTSPETFPLINSLNLKEHYAERLETLSFFGFNWKAKDKPVPTYEKVVDSFSPEELELAKTFQKPTLLLIPQCSFDRKVKAMNEKKGMDGQIDCYLSNIFQEDSDTIPHITGWKVMIVDGATTMQLKTGDNKDATFKDRIASRKAAYKKKADGTELEKGLDREAYAMLMMEGLRKGDPIDKYDGKTGSTFTLLDGDPANSTSNVPHAFWNSDNRLVFFHVNDPDDVNADARFRSGVGGRVLS